jgi:hypothetical protein
MHLVLLSIGNMVSEVSKCMDGVTLAACRELFSVIRFILDTKLFCLKIKINESWRRLEFLITFVVIHLGIQRITLESQSSSFTCWEYSSIGAQRDRKMPLFPEVKKICGNVVVKFVRPNDLV